MPYTIPNYSSPPTVAQHRRRRRARCRGRRRHRRLRPGARPGAVGWNWTSDLCDTLIRDIVPMKKLEELLGRSGIDNKTTIVLRRQQQLVCRLGVLAIEDLRPRRCPHHGRRTEEMAGRGPRTQHRQAGSSGKDLQGHRSGHVAACSSRSSGSGQEQVRVARRRAQPTGVHRRDSRAARTA